MAVDYSIIFKKNLSHVYPRQLSSNKIDDKDKKYGRKNL